MSWPLVNLGSIAEKIDYGLTASANFELDEPKFLRITDLQDGSVDWSSVPSCECSEKDVDQYKLENGDIVFARTGATTGKSYLLRDLAAQAVFASYLIRLRPKKNVDSSYLAHFFQSPNYWSQINVMANGAAQPGVNASKLKELSVPLPPLEEQKRIAAILDKADAIRRKRQQAIKLADDFLRSVFLEMFGDPVTNPKGWEVRPLISLCTDDFQNGAYFPPESYADDGVEMVHMSDAFYDTVQRGALRRVRCSLDDEKKYGLNETQLLISRRSLTYEGAAKPSLIPASDEPLIFESSLIRVSPSNDKMLTRFLFQYLSTESVKEHHIRKYVTGATIKGISQKNLEKISVYVPPIGLQEEFSLVVSKVGRLIQNGMASSIVDSRLFQSVSQKAFSGTL